MAKLNETKVKMLLGLIERKRITVEEIKDAAYQAEVRKLLGGSVK